MRKRINIFVIAVFVLVLCAGGAYAGQDDSVESQHIKEADGTTGQDTNRGSGVKTGHIQDGAVTDAKITGPISGSKISSAGLDADTVDGLHAADLAGRYSNVAVVALSGGDYTDPATAMYDSDSWCATPSSTNPCLLKIMPGIYDISAIGDVMMKAHIDIEGSGEEGTVIKILSNRAVWGADNAEIRNLTVENLYSQYPRAMYNWGTSPKITNVTLKSSGATYGQVYGIQNQNNAPIIENVTIIVADAPDSVFGIYNNNSSPIIKNVNISASGSDRWVNGIRNFGNSSPLIKNVTITVDAGIDLTSGIYSNNGASPVMDNVTITATGTSYVSGVTVSAGSLASSSMMTNMAITSSGDGLRVEGASTATINRSSIHGASSVSVEDLTNTVNIGLSQLDGLITGTGTFNCYGVYDANYQDVICP